MTSIDTEYVLSYARQSNAADSSGSSGLSGTRGAPLSTPAVAPGANHPPIACSGTRTERQLDHRSDERQNRRYALPHSALGARKRVSPRTSAQLRLSDELARIEGLPRGPLACLGGLKKNPAPDGELARPDAARAGRANGVMTRDAGNVTAASCSGPRNVRASPRNGGCGRELPSSVFAGQRPFGQVSRLSKQNPAYRPTRHRL
jgi:hypothetical protein